jgi:outer membrane protein assembly factor BamB
VFFFQARYQADPGASWLLQGAADGVMLFVSSEGKMVAANALTKRFRLLPDTKVSPRLCLESCLKKKLRGSNSATISINIVVDPADKTFKVIVWGELRLNQVHALVYSSAADVWTVKLCSGINCRLFRRPFQSTVDGNSIYFSSMDKSVLVRYDTETGLFEANLIDRFNPRLLGRLVKPVHDIMMVVYKNQIFLLGVIVCRSGHSSALVALWKANHTHSLWEFQTAHGLQFASCEVAAAYDGKHNIIIIPRMQGSKMIFLNLNTREWRMSDGDTQWRSPDRNPRQQNVSEAFRAFHLKLKFCTAI